MELLTICVKTTYFQIEEKFYQQEFGMAMGSPLSPIISNIFMEEFEQQAISEFPDKPRIWLRYVDDTFVIWQHGRQKLDNFLEHLNNRTPSIKFTMEMESDSNKLPFLDVLVHRNGNSFNTSVYRKPTHTGRYLHYDSNHHNSVKTGVARCLYERAEAICSEQEELKREKEIIAQTLKENGYPNRLTTNLDLTSNLQRKREAEEEPKYTAVIPYIPGTSDKIRRIGKKYNIRTAFKSTKTIRGILTKTKPPNEDQSSKNGVYNLPCECGRAYIGESSRPLRVRISEHKNNIRKGETEKSRIAEHVWSEGHHIQWDDAEIVAKDENHTRRKLKEATYIALAEEPISQASLEIKPIWMPLLRKELTRRPPPAQRAVAQDAQSTTAQPAQ